MNKTIIDTHQTIEIMNLLRNADEIKEEVKNIKSRLPKNFKIFMCFNCYRIFAVDEIQMQDGFVDTCLCPNCINNFVDNEM